MIAHFLLQGTLQAVSPSPRGYCDGFARNFQQLPLGYLTGENLLQPNLVTNRFHSLSPLKPPMACHRPDIASRYRKPSRFLSSRSEEHTSELQSRENLVCRLLLEKKNNDT